MESVIVPELTPTTSGDTAATSTMSVSRKNEPDCNLVVNGPVTRTSFTRDRSPDSPLATNTTCADGIDESSHGRIVPNDSDVVDGVYDGAITSPSNVTGTRMSHGVPMTTAERVIGPGVTGATMRTGMLFDDDAGIVTDGPINETPSALSIRSIVTLTSEVFVTVTIVSISD